MQIILLGIAASKISQAQLKEEKMSDPSCVFCASLVDQTDCFYSCTFWRVIINRNQDYLGKVMLVLNRHEEDVTALKPPEQVEFWQILATVKKALTTLFKPDHFNYAFLMNQDTHTHLHMIPRYNASRVFAGLIFIDDHLGEHHPIRENLVDIKVRRELSGVLRDLMPDTSRN